MSSTRKRLKKIEAAVGESDEHWLGVEFHKISADGELVRLTDPHLRVYARPKAKRVIRVVFVPPMGTAGQKRSGGETREAINPSVRRG